MFEFNEIVKAAGAKIIRAGNRRQVQGISIDSRTIKRGEAFFAIKGSNFDGHAFIAEALRKGASCIIKSTGYTAKISSGAACLEVKDTIRALGKLACFQRKKYNIPLIAVTGSNGKTTTKEMIAWVLSAKYQLLKNQGTQNNHIGLPLTLLKLNKNHGLAVLEIGTNHFGEVRYLTRICLPNVGVITNIGPSHLEYLNDLEGVSREKYSLLENLIHPAIAVINGDDALLKRKITLKAKRPFMLQFGRGAKADFSASGIEKDNSGITFLVNGIHKCRLRSLGEYNIYNALAAIGVARIYGIDYKDIALKLSEFDFPKSRLEMKEYNQATFIDDTYNSNPLSLQRALEALDSFKAKGRKIFVMGDMLELGRKSKTYHSHAGKEISKVCDIVITVGELARMAAEKAGSLRVDSKNIFTCQSADQAKDVLFNLVSPGKDDVVLLKGSRMIKLEEILNQE